MQVTELIGHPELLSRDTLYELRRVVSVHPYYHAARLLLLENLFLLHDPDFDAELHRAALFVPDRQVIFDLVESINYEISSTVSSSSDSATSGNPMDLIDQFLKAMPPMTTGRRRSIDPVSDYVSLLEGMDDVEDTPPEYPTIFPLAKEGKMVEPLPEQQPTDDAPDDSKEEIEEEYFTETLAKVFIKQGNYERAIEILTKINLDNPRKNAYFADQIRFLQKSIIARGAK